MTVRRSGSSVIPERFEAHVDVLGDEGLQGYPGLQADAHTDGHRVEEATQSGALLAELDEDLTQRAVGVGVGGEVEVGAADSDRSGVALAPLRHPAAGGEQRSAVTVMGGVLGLCHKICELQRCVS